MTNTKWRHEDKYLLGGGQVVMLRNRLAGLMRPDINSNADGSYLVRSVYFDSVDLSCYREIEDGTDPREKFRIRTYNADTSRITLELKRKQRGRVNKISCPISEDVCRHLINGEMPGVGADEPELLRQLVRLMRSRLYRPAVIVEYTRIPLVYGLSNTRVTFDLDLASSHYVRHFLAANIPRRLVMPAGWHIMEIKWDEFLPDHIRQGLQTEGLNKNTFSKYLHCRQAGP